MSESGVLKTKTPVYFVPILEICVFKEIVPPIII